MSALLALWAAAIAGFDLRTRRIPNLALLLLLVPALLALAVNREGLLGVAPGSSLLGLLAVGLFMLPGYRLGKTGAGDVKFAACLGLLLGLQQGLEFLLLALIALGLVSLGALAWQAARGPLDLQRRLPAGVALAAAFCLELAAGPLLPTFRA